MKKVITYGTFDLLHYGHINLLKRAKELGDYLIVAVTSDDFDKSRGKINVKQPLMERIEAVRNTGLADEIIIEEYEGQKIDDIIKYDIDIFTVGTDWVGKFDYLNEYCKVVYLERTRGVSSSKIRSEEKKLRLGFIGDSNILFKHLAESHYVNGIEPVAVFSEIKIEKYSSIYTSSYEEVLEKSDAVYIITPPDTRYEYIKKALKEQKHVICEAPIALETKKCKELFEYASNNKLILMEAIKTAHSTAFNRMCLLVKSGEIGDIVSIESTCTSLAQIDFNDREAILGQIDSMCDWAPTAFLPILKKKKKNYRDYRIITKKSPIEKNFDLFTKCEFIYDKAIASFKIGKGVKSEGELIITGTKGYAYIPAPWWKTDYFEIRYENQSENKRFFYQLEGEGIRNELVAFLKYIEKRKSGNADKTNSIAISSLMENYYADKNCIHI